MGQTMRKRVKSERARCKIVSLRLSENEWENLARICEATGQTVSEYLRAALGLRPRHAPGIPTLAGFAEDFQLLKNVLRPRH